MAEGLTSDNIIQNIKHMDNISNPESTDKNLPSIVDNKPSYKIDQTNSTSGNQIQLIIKDKNQAFNSKIEQIHQPIIQYKNNNDSVQQKQGQQQEYNENQYNQLTNKLQSALNKIQSTKNKQMKKTLSQSQNIIVRFQEIENRKKKEIMKKKEECQKNKEKQLKEKPTIDKNSQKISKELGHKPIYLRVDKLVEEKKRKLQENEEMKKKKEQQEIQKYLQQLDKCTKKPQQIRSYDQYFNEMVRWKEKRIQENKQKHQINKGKQLQGITFKPTLNKKSEKMMASQSRIPIQQRPLKKRKNGQQSMYVLKHQHNQKSTKL